MHLKPINEHKTCPD